MKVLSRAQSTIQNLSSDEISCDISSLNIGSQDSSKEQKKKEPKKKKQKKKELNIEKVPTSAPAKSSTSRGPPGPDLGAGEVKNSGHW